jgi:Protein of unknown function (DUF1203)
MLDTTIDTPTTLLVHAIDPGRLDRLRITGVDGHGNDLRPFPATGDGEPLRCCLRYAEAKERIALISFAPFDHPSVWTEVGPVYVHAEKCGGYPVADRLPAQLATGPRVLRTYRADDTMDYEHNTVVPDTADLEPIVKDLLSQREVETVHVRTLAPQCFLYAVTASTGGLDRRADQRGRNAACASATV